MSWEEGNYLKHQLTIGRRLSQNTNWQSTVSKAQDADANMRTPMVWRDTRSRKVCLLQSLPFSITCVPFNSSHPRNGKEEEFRVETVEIKKTSDESSPEWWWYSTLIIDINVVIVMNTMTMMTTMTLFDYNLHDELCTVRRNVFAWWHNSTSKNTLDGITPAPPSDFCCSWHKLHMQLVSQIFPFDSMEDFFCCPTSKVILAAWRWKVWKKLWVVWSLALKWFDGNKRLAKQLGFMKPYETCWLLPIGSMYWYGIFTLHLP